MTTSEADAPPPLLPSAVAGAIRPLEPVRDGEAAAILGAGPGEGAIEAGRDVLLAARQDPRSAVYGLFVGVDLAAVYVLRLAGVTAELAGLAVAEAWRGRGHDRACLADALRRAGKRPLVVETDDAALEFYRAAGFKLVGKRRHPSGVIRYRLGWHAPRIAVVGATRAEGRGAT